MSVVLTADEMALKAAIETARVACDMRDFEAVLRASAEISQCITDKAVEALGIDPAQVQALLDHLNDFQDSDVSDLLDRITANQNEIGAVKSTIEAEKLRLNSAVAQIAAESQNAQKARDALAGTVDAVNDAIGVERDRLTTYKSTNDAEVATIKGNISLLLESKASVESRLAALEACCAANGSAITLVNERIAEFNASVEALADEIESIDKRLTDEVVRLDGRIDAVTQGHTAILDVLEVLKTMEEETCASRNAALAALTARIKAEICSGTAPSGTTDPTPTPSTSGAAGSI